MIQRILKNQIESKLLKGKAIVIYGARQVGKSSLVISVMLTPISEIVTPSWVLWHNVMFSKNVIFLQNYCFFLTRTSYGVQVNFHLLDEFYEKNVPICRAMRRQLFHQQILQMNTRTSYVVLVKAVLHSVFTS